MNSQSKKKLAFKDGGDVSTKAGKGPRPFPYNAEGSPAMKEADEEKRGGRIKRASGGAVKKTELRAFGGAVGKRRLDRPGRKRGGSVGADMHPLTSAAKTKNAEGHDTEASELEDD